MSRKRADLVEVRGGTGLPTHFLWRDKVYAVREVLGHWKESGAWWEEARTASFPAVHASASGSAGTAAARPLDRTEREVWRVEASPGRCFAPGVYDLSFDRSADRWTLTSTTD
ncbi:DUF6504 family protein [Streptacidiphilus fuscans]|uniref:DUF6504 domain-containing protein n=1 Tax=Streptacidiphilus fuscans TaxID=2789292 RepID=A0A931FG70_9ACTN|nr:DUF6504 family protein [Streptacidiphilus fuscans]MBF9071000.1 hypothetical protein [Streptacidiphilus fuscans]